MMSNDKIERAMQIVSQINAMIDFAENEGAFLVAAKLEDARIAMLDQFVDGANRPT